MNKYSLNNNQWIWDHNIDPDLLYDINDKRTMYERGKYLTEIIDKIPNKATSSDIENLPTGKVVVSYGPSSGKTTAIRQFILKSMKQGKFGVFATKLVSDVDSLYYDLLSQYYYLENSNPLSCSISKFHSKCNPQNLSDLRKSFWIICTHERLFIEPPSLIMTMDIALTSKLITNPYDLYRDYILVDEYPTNMYKSVEVYSVSASLEMLKYHLGITEDTSEVAKGLLINGFVTDAYKNEINNPKLLYIVENLPNLVRQSYTQDQKRGIQDIKTELSIERTGFFANLFMNKLNDYDKINDELKSKNDKLYYSILDLISKNMYIFDGTGDIIFRDNKKFSIIKDKRFMRKLILNSVFRIKTRVTRKFSTEMIITEYSYIINQICNSHKDKRILVYTWLNSKKKGDSNSNIINELIDTIDYPDRVDFIHYNSGNERVTSDYVNNDVLVILGKFLIPNSVINEINTVIGTKLSSYDYTKSLIIQAIYRTSARLNHSIDLYFSSDYSEDFLLDILSEFDELSGNTELRSLSLELPELKIDPEYNPMISSIIDSNLGYMDNNEYVINSKDLASVLGFTKIDNTNIRNKLDKNFVNYELISSKGGRSKVSIFRIKLF